MPRPTIAIALPVAEAAAVSAELAEAGFEPVAVEDAAQLSGLLAERRSVAVAILDGEQDLDTALELYGVLQDRQPPVPALMVVSPSSFDRLAGAGGGGADDEYLVRPYSTEAVRWRIEAMCIRSATVDDGSGEAVLAGGLGEGLDWASLGTVLVVFNPKGGVGKTTIATNLAAAIQARGDQQVLLVDADTVTGHILVSLGLETAPTLADAWRDEAEGGPVQTLTDLAAPHSSGMRVMALTGSPIHVDVLAPDRVAATIEAARRAFDIVVVDLHPSYSALNRAIFRTADRVLVPVTPDVPALRATVQFIDVSEDLGIRDRLTVLVNRANSGVSIPVVENALGSTVFAQIRSGGMVFVTAANEGRTAIDRFPKEKVTGDFHDLAQKLFASVPREIGASSPAKGGLRLLGRRISAGT
jgi:pilus assembly protein CpaE